MLPAANLLARAVETITQSIEHKTGYKKYKSRLKNNKKKLKWNQRIETTIKTELLKDVCISYIHNMTQNSSDNLPS